MNDQIKNLANEILTIKDKLEYNNSCVLCTYEDCIDDDNADVAFECYIEFSSEFDKLINCIISDTPHNVEIGSNFIKVSFLGGEHHSILEDKMRENAIKALTPLCNRLIDAINKL